MGDVGKGGNNTSHRETVIAESLLHILLSECVLLYIGADLLYFYVQVQVYSFNEFKTEVKYSFHALMGLSALGGQKRAL